MRAIAAILVLLAVASQHAGQAHKPKGKPIQTDLRLDIEGRGMVLIELFENGAPKTVGHIEDLVRQGFYDGQRFHRVEKWPKPYLVQVGDPASKSGDLEAPSMGSGGSGTTVPYEDSGHENLEGAVGLAHVVEQEDTGDSQFFMLLSTSKFLNGHYTVFGQVIRGMDVVKRIQMGDRIQSAEIITG